MARHLSHSSVKTEPMFGRESVRTSTVPLSSSGTRQRPCALGPQAGGAGRGVRADPPGRGAVPAAQARAYPRVAAGVAGTDPGCAGQ